jgi:uncharacterized protein (DUF2235 family)
MAGQAHQAPRRIVLLSDGTGNSSAKLMKTNVWRLYEALKLSTGDQIAMYDNGVGTSSFKLFAVLGGALGWGLKRNVRHLYMFACRNYTPATAATAADELYAFGFSRGAFTIRVLVGLIEDQGLITGVSGRELERRAKWAYRAYRRTFNPTKGLVTPLRSLRDFLLRTWDSLRGRPTYDKAANLRPRVRFVGLWDTVDAYGLPIDEMTRGWDKWVWPLSMSQRTCQAIVDKFCHAIALDDERHTFHPVLLDESAEQPRAHIDEEIVTQVWFAGMHSNVGGGYPDDSLAHVPLRWMADQAAKAGLDLHAHVVAEWDARADPCGPMYDSRRGLASYYRYNPRSIVKLTDDRFADVHIPRPKIHESVFQRIAASRDDYAPIVLPSRYAIVTATGDVIDNGQNPYEHPTQSRSRCADQERVWNKVWQRRITYFATVAVTCLIAVPPLLVNAGGGAWLPWTWNGASQAIALAGQMAPGTLQPWVAYYESYPYQLAIPGAVLIVLLLAGVRLQRSIGDGMRRLWDGIIRNKATAVVPSDPPTDAIYRLRTHPLYRGTFEVVTQHLFPFIFGLVALAAVVLIVLGTVNRALFALAGATGNTCPKLQEERRPDPPPAAASADKAVTWTVEFPNNELCYSTGIPLEPDMRYQVRIALPAEGPDVWKDETHAVTKPEGFSSGENLAIFVPALPFRRVLTTQWFVPIARIGSHGAAEYHPLGQALTEITPRRSGQLFLFVNDAIGIPWRRFYRNNTGKPAVVTVKRLGPAATG